MAAKYDPEKAKKLNENTYQGLRELPSVMYDQAKKIGESSLYNTSQSQLNNERGLSDESNQRVMETMRGWFGGNQNQQQNIPSVPQQPQQQQVNVQPESIASNKFNIQNSSAKPYTGLQQLAIEHGENSPKFQKAALRASVLGVYPENETPNNLIKEPVQQPSQKDVQQPQSIKTIHSSQPQTTQVIRDGQALNQSFTSDGNGGYNSRMYDAAGNELSRADQEQMRLMSQARRLVDLATPVYSISNPHPEQQAASALQAMSALKAIPTVSDVQKDASAIRKMDTDTSLAPGLANSEIGLRGAQANRYNVESQYMPQRFAMEQQAHNTESKYKQAQIDNLNRKQGMTGRDFAALEKVELDRRIAFNEAYNSAIMNNPKIDKNSLRRDLERQFGLNKAQRRSATEFQN